MWSVGGDTNEEQCPEINERLKPRLLTHREGREENVQFVVHVCMFRSSTGVELC